MIRPVRMRAILKCLICSALTLILLTPDADSADSSNDLDCDEDILDDNDSDSKDEILDLDVLREALQHSRYFTRNDSNDLDCDEDILDDNDSDSKDEILDLDVLREALQHSRYFTRNDRWEKSSNFLYQFF
ncbi:hypothetical protein R1sor_006166 [Riccia sorocarpa]|uniref:Uncharacterized protein n=1 Tax=Riccia sorocarpa TaxID=122646 RepID=A0ABD3HQH1_9MARC